MLAAGRMSLPATGIALRMNTAELPLVIEFGAVHPSQVRNPEAVDLLRQWRLLQELDPDVAVSREAFESVLTPRQAGQLLILRRLDAGGDFRVHRHGSVCVAQMQIDARGQRLSDLAGELAGWVRQAALTTLRERAPHRGLSLAEPGQPVATWEQLMFPLRDEHGHDWVLVYRWVVEWRHQYADAALHQLGTAALCLRARHAGVHAVTGWHVLSANPALGRLCGVDAGALVGGEVSAVLPLWPQLDLAAECAAVLHSGRPTELTRLFIDPRAVARQVSVHIAPMHNGVVLSLTDVTRLMRGHVQPTRALGPDALSGIADRRGYDERLRAEVLCARRAGDGPSLVLVEIDPLLAQETEATDALDLARLVARLLTDACGREGDLVARLDASTFALLLPATDLNGAQVVASRLQRALDRVAATGASLPGRLAGGLCAGIATYNRDADGEHLQARAEQALLAAQRLGGGRIVVDAGWRPVAGQPGARVSQALPGVEVSDVTLDELSPLGGGLFSTEAGEAAGRAHPADPLPAAPERAPRLGGWAGSGWSATKHR
jgi:diguanylate cyclase (GGDEF)-like protein